jgi:hypothetical protein
MAALNRCWRVAVVAACFAGIGVGGVICSLTLFPLLRLVSRSAAQSQRRARVVIRYSFRALAAVLEWGGVMRVEGRNLERLRGLLRRPRLDFGQERLLLVLRALLAV